MAKAQTSMTYLLGGAGLLGPRAEAAEQPSLRVRSQRVMGSGSMALGGFPSRDALMRQWEQLKIPHLVHSGFQLAPWMLS